jgi:hypothetical protein
MWMIDVFFERDGGEKLIRIVAGIEGVGVNVVQIEQHVRAGCGDRAGNPESFIHRAVWRIEQRSDVLNRGCSAGDPSCELDVFAESGKRVAIARRRARMRDVPSNIPAVSYRSDAPLTQVASDPRV